MLQLNTVILNLAIARYLELPTAFATLNLLTKHEDMNQDPSELVLSLHHSISYLFVLIHHYDKSEKKKKKSVIWFTFFTPWVLGVSRFELCFYWNYLQNYMTTIICISLQYYQVCIIGGKNIKEKCDSFLMKINVCLFASIPAFIYSPNWMSEKGVFVKCHPAVFF